MKTKDVPNEAWAALSTDIPTRVVPDWAALYAILEEKGWVVIESSLDDIRETCNGSCESKMFKDFRNYALNNKRMMLNARRIGALRWYVVIGKPARPKKEKKDEDQDK